ncbi:MAG: hypothetical protein K5878_11655 [Rhizobiaceae bacterium]|nr:hypothetical protein [Rhizobiaceae bacterium]
MRFKSAVDVFEALPAAHDDISAEPTDAPPVEYLRTLVASATPEDAITFCAYMLGRREAVWWGHQCLNAVPETLDQNDQDLLGLAEDWVRDPEEERRNAALEAGMAARMKTPGAWVALGAGWSGGSMTPPDSAPVPPPPHLTAKAINAAVLSVLARVPLANRASTLKSFVDMGIQLYEAQ